MTDIVLSTSLDPIWNLALTGAPGSNLKPCYGGGVWLIAVDSATPGGDTTKIWRSMDGVNWTQVPLPFNGDWVKCLWLQNELVPNGMFVLISGNSTNDNRCALSPNGLFWTQSALPANSSWLCSDVVNGYLFMAEYRASSQWYSRDGVHFTHTINNTSGVQLAGTVYAKGKYWLFGSSVRDVWTFPDPSVPYTVTPTNYSPTLVPIFGNGVFCSGDSPAFYSADGINWTQCLFSDGSNVGAMYNLEYDAIGGRFIGMNTSNNRMLVSEDGLHWKLSNYPWQGHLPNYLAASQARPQQFVGTASAGGNQGQYGQYSSIRGKLFVPHNFTKLVKVS